MFTERRPSLIRAAVPVRHAQHCLPNAHMTRHAAITIHDYNYELLLQTMATYIRVHDLQESVWFTVFTCTL